jgi:transcription antitermination factor NusG
MPVRRRQNDAIPPVLVRGCLDQRRSLGPKFLNEINARSKVSKWSKDFASRAREMASRSKNRPIPLSVVRDGDGTKSHILENAWTTWTVWTSPTQSMAWLGPCVLFSLNQPWTNWTKPSGDGAVMTSGRIWKVGDRVEVEPRYGEASEPLPTGSFGEHFWYVAHTMAGCERRLGDDLEAIGIEVFLPLRKWLCRRPGRRVVKFERPLFSRYVFINLMPHPRSWAAVRQARDLVGILTNQDVPVRVPDEAIGDLMVAVDMKLFDETQLPNGIEVLKGDRVSVVGGNWQGYEAVVESRVKGWAGLVIDGPRGKSRAKLPIDLLRILA